MSQEKGLIDNLAGLRLIYAVARTGSLKGGAEQMGLSLSAASHQLATMRTFFSDELFVRTGRGLMPTAKMKSLQAKIREILSSVDSLTQDADFDPAGVSQEFRIQTYDNGYVAFILPVLKKILTEAPGLRLNIHFLETKRSADALRKGEVDLCINPIPPEDTDIISAPLRELDYVMLMRREHPFCERYRLKHSFEWDWLLEYTQFVPSDKKIGYYRPWIDLKEKGMRTVRCPYFHSTAFFLLKTNAIEWIPESSAKNLEMTGLFSIVKPGRSQRSHFTPKLYWSINTDKDPLHQWIRSIILARARETGPSQEPT